MTASVLATPTTTMEELFLERIDSLRDAHLDQVMALIDEVAREATPEGSTLVEMNRYHLSTGGKRLRALLPMAVADSLGQDPAQLIPFSAACEILHNATLVHDDLQDGDTTRRGHATIWKKYGAPQAINLGDAMLYYTLLLTGCLPGEAAVRERVSHRILRETIRVIDGQEREFQLQQMQMPEVADYIRMVEGKTSGLFSLPMAGAAEFCGASNELIAALEQAAQHLGVLFQIQDDVLDLYGDKGRERRGSDIAEGKMSILAVHALHHAEEADSLWLRALLKRDRDDVSDDDITRAIGIFESAGSLRYALDEIERRRNAAVQDPRLAERDQVRALVGAMADVFLAPIRSLMQ